MKALTLTNDGNQKIHGQCKRFCGKTNGRTDKQANGRAKNYMPPIYRCRDIKGIPTIKSLVQFTFKVALQILGQKFYKNT